MASPSALVGCGQIVTTGLSLFMARLIGIVRDDAHINRSSSTTGSSVKSLIAQLIPHELRQSIKRRLFAVRDMRTRLENLRRAGFHPTGVIDGGAYRGGWTREVWAVWSGTPSAMVEPLPARRAELEDLAATVGRSFVVSAALAAADGSAMFSLGETNSRISDGEVQSEAIEVECITIASLLRQHPTFSPNFLKLDLQGFEIPALIGAGDRLRSFEVVLLEVSVIRIGDVPTFSEVDRFMAERNYRVYDVIPQYYRPLDGALWQMDVFFVRNDSPLVASRAWA